MKTDISGTSQCAPGQEVYETFPAGKHGEFVQYDYRDNDGQLYSTIAPSLEKARERRDKWMQDKTKS